MWGSTRARMLITLATLALAPAAALGLYLLAAAGSGAEERRVGLALAVTLPVALLVGSIAALALTRSISRPLSALRDAARRTAAGGEPQAAAPAGPPDQRALVDTWNSALAALQRTREAVVEERDRLEQALGAAADVVIAVDAARHVVYANPAAAQHLHADVVEAVGQSLLALVPDHEIYDLAAQALRGETPGPVLVSRGERHYQAVAKPVSGRGGWFAVVVLHDVSALHAAEAARRNLVADISHELRNPISTIAAAAETLERGVGPDDARRFQRIIHTEADRMAQMVQEMLTLARLESGLAQPQMRSLDLRHMLAEAVEQMTPQAERAGLTVALTAPSAPLTLDADADLVQRALGNLLDNAIKFTPAPGAITVFAQAEDEAVWLLVRDTGVGLSAEEQRHVFQRFYRADRARGGSGGAGLGLALVRHIAEAHGGTVRVESAPGRGSTFGFSLPRVQERGRHDR